MKRLLTAAVGVPLAVAAVFHLPPGGFFLLVLILIELGVLEFIRLTGRWAPARTTSALLLIVPAVAVVLALPAERWPQVPAPGLLLALAAAVGLGSLVLATRAPVGQSVGALGVLCFGVPYFALPVATLSLLQRHDPWVLLLLLAIVWLGDSAAYYCGRAWGRRKLAPVVSPNKTWEGAAASLIAALAAAAVWSWWRLGAMDGRLLALAAVASVAGQVGDLVESMIKRGAGVKDSGHFFPGHGGVLDRMDALLFAAPVMWLGVALVGDPLLRP